MVKSNFVQLKKLDPISYPFGGQLSRRPGDLDTLSFGKLSGEVESYPHASSWRGGHWMAETVTENRKARAWSARTWRATCTSAIPIGN